MRFEFIAECLHRANGVLQYMYVKQTRQLFKLVIQSVQYRVRLAVKAHGTPFKQILNVKIQILVPTE